jgi:enamine deaminase RidA (YjgF/YER057c/UK114 family)
MNDPSVRYDLSQQLSREIAAARILREHVESMVGDDADAIRDAIEGETTLLEQIGALALSIASDEAFAKAASDLAEQIKARSARFENRAEMKRALISTALEIAERKSLETPAGTVTLKSVPPKLQITEEADVPARFFKQPAPVIDRRSLLDALKQREAAMKEASDLSDTEARAEARAKVEATHPAIPGACLSNGGKTIQIRR